METNRTCPGCNKPLPVDVPLGLCPQCLVKAGFGTGTEPSGSTKDFAPLPVAEIARLFPQFEIIGLIGKGGMGAVYKARQPGLDRFVALKILPPHAANDPGFVERFNREARALARLNHPNIVAVYDFGTVNPSGPAGTNLSPIGEKPEASTAPILNYLLMEFIDGPNLRELERSGRLAPEQALQIIPQICEALQFAHNEGVVHRDIKPENILLDKKGWIKITDFGIAKIIGTTPEKAALTGGRDVVGTPHYMAPEQLERPNTVDHRADIFSLGVVFYELLTGELPIGKFAPPSGKAQVDVRLDDVVLRALEKEPERRYQHVSEVKTDVEKIAATPPAVPPLKPRPPAVPIPEPIESRFSRKAIVGAACVALSFLVFLAFFQVQMVPQPVSASHPPAWFLISFEKILLPLELLAPFVATILGCIAINEIRRSVGRLYGMPLAVFDALFFPLLLLDGLVGWVWRTVIRIIPDIFALSPALIEDLAALNLLLTLLTSAVIDVFIVWLVWRAVRTPLPDASPGKVSRGSQPLWIVLGVVAAVFIVFALAALLFFGTFVAAKPRAAHLPAPPPAMQIERGNESPQGNRGRRQLTTVSDSEMRKLLIDLKSPEIALHNIAASRLVSIRPDEHQEEVEAQLLILLNSEQWPTRQYAATALGVWGTDKAYAPLVAASDDSMFSVRWAILNSLAQIGGVKAAPLLAKHLSNPQDSGIVGDALKSLGSAAEDTVIPLLQDKDPQVRYAACRILREIGTSKSIAALTAAANGFDHATAMMAKDALKAIESRQ